MKSLILCVATAAVVAWAASCRRPVDFVTAGELAFSPRDSVKFDTLFSGVPSPTQRLYIYNRSGKNLRIKKIFVEGGESSPFKLTLDALAGQTHLDYELAKGDSLYAFFTYQKEVTRDEDVSDRLIVELDNVVYRITLFARTLDARFFRFDTADCNSVLPNDKPVVIDGPLYVPEGCTLTIPAGSKLYFTARRDKNFNFVSRIDVEGTLLVEGVKGAEVLMTNFRLNENYQELAGQWYGLIFRPNSRGNSVKHALIKNGTIGVRVDSSAVTNRAKVTLEQTDVRNMSAYCVYAVGYSPDTGRAPGVAAVNCVFSRAGESVCALVLGGWYEFLNCTFYNDNEVSARHGLTVSASNARQYKNENGETISENFPMRVALLNSIVWGVKEWSFAYAVADFDAPKPTTFVLLRNIFRARRESAPELYDALERAGNFMNRDPMFENPFKRDFRIRASSPARDAAEPLFAPFYDFNLNPRPFGPAPDIGAFEFSQSE
jgi:hypothetical protein